MKQIEPEIEKPPFLYKPSPTGIRFHDSDAPGKIELGPFGSGKSCTCAEDILLNAMAQYPASNGVRYSKWLVIRGSYPQLSSTTRDSLLEVLPKKSGYINQGNYPLKGHYYFGLGDGTFVSMEFILAPIATMADLEKIRSMNVTGVWINELTSVPVSAIGEIKGRAGRYPPASLGGCRWGGVIADTNKPPAGHEVSLFLKNLPKDWELFVQPPSAFKRIEADGSIHYDLNPDAENLENLGENYYQEQIDIHLAAGEYDKIDILHCLLDGMEKSGRPVFERTFSKDLHVTKDIVQPNAYAFTLVGYDTSGVHPAVAFFQEINGKWTILHEITGENMGLEFFMDQVVSPFILANYTECDILFSLDPANASDGFTGQPPSKHITNRGYKVWMPPTNNPKARITAVNTLLNRHAGGLCISSNCVLTMGAFESEYKYKEMKVQGSAGVTYEDKPIKNVASHIMDAVQYGCMFITKKGDNELHGGQRNAAIEAMSQRRKRLRRKV